ncbi:hypothetical protein GvMRE_IIg145 [endosymbiont GvMRE of Glomus versiforme]|nr:hypothetical protein GvMRE_IIg145 [endosymbiont GvMRE of Glomus versiforme]
MKRKQKKYSSTLSLKKDIHVDSKKKSSAVIKCSLTCKKKPTRNFCKNCEENNIALDTLSKKVKRIEDLVKKLSNVTKNTNNHSTIKTIPEFPNCSNTKKNKIVNFSIFLT